MKSNEWTTPVIAIRKRNNEAALCGDYKATISLFLKIDENSLPSIDELVVSMMSDMSSLQLDVHPDDRDVFTLYLNAKANHI